MIQSILIFALARHSSEELHNSGAGQAGIQLFVKQPCVYILASAFNGTLYVGVTSDLIRRITEHKDGVIEGFTKTHRIHNLVWFKQHSNMQSVITREKAIKAWKRQWKVELFERTNPKWRDLYSDAIG